MEQNRSFLSLLSKVEHPMTRKSYDSVGQHSLYTNLLSQPRLAYLSASITVTLEKNLLDTRGQST